MALPLVWKVAKMARSWSVIDPSSVNSLVIPAAASVFCRLAISAREQMPGTPSSGRRMGVMSCCAARSPPSPSVTAMIPSDKMTEGASSRANKKPSFAPVPPSPRNVRAPFTGPKLPFRTVKSSTRHHSVLLAKKPEKNTMVSTNAR